MCGNPVHRIAGHRRILQPLIQRDIDRTDRQQKMLHLSDERSASVRQADHLLFVLEQLSQRSPKKVRDVLREGVAVKYPMPKILVPAGGVDA